MNPKPAPKHLMVLDDDGIPNFVMNVDTIQTQSIQLAYDMAVACGVPDDLDKVSALWLGNVGPDAFGYVAAGALRNLAEHILEPVLQIADEIASHYNLRAGLADAARNAKETL